MFSPSTMNDLRFAFRQLLKNPGFIGTMLSAYARCAKGASRLKPLYETGV